MENEVIELLLNLFDNADARQYTELNEVKIADLKCFIMDGFKPGDYKEFLETL